MKPLKLKIEGIRSFSEMVEIDFDDISKSGLFGHLFYIHHCNSSALDYIAITIQP